MKFFLATITCLVTISVSAQDFRFGAGVGVNLHGISSQVLDYKPGLGYQIDTDIEYRKFDPFQLSTGISLVRKNSYNQLLLTNEQGEAADEVKWKMNLSYLRIPIKALYKLSPSMRAFAGPHLEFLLAEEQSVEKNDYATDDDFDVERGLFNDLDFGYQVGLDYQVGTIRFVFTYNNNLRKLYNVDSDLKVSHGLSLTASYWLN